MNARTAELVETAGRIFERPACDFAADFPYAISKARFYLALGIFGESFIRKMSRLEMDESVLRITCENIIAHANARDLDQIHDAINRLPQFKKVLNA